MLPVLTVMPDRSGLHRAARDAQAEQRTPAQGRGDGV